MNSSYNACISNDRLTMLALSRPKQVLTHGLVSNEDGIKLPGISMVSVSLHYYIYINNISHATGISITR
jgi:hypothetical protein